MEVDLEILPKVLDILDLIVHFKTKHSGEKNKYSNDIYSITSDFGHNPKCKSIGRQCVDLVIKSVANHRYKEGAELLWMLCQDKSVYKPFLFKSAMIVLLNLEFKDKNESVYKIISAVQSFKGMNKREAQLEYIMHTLKNDLHNVHKAIEELSLRNKTFHRKHDDIDPLLIAYIALLDYIDWSNSFYGDMMPSQNQASRERAILEFEKFIENPGDWDIFIVKLIKMLQSCDREDEIEAALLKYVNSNPDNINAYIYLCVYLYQNNPESEYLIKFLEILADMCPSDTRVLWLLEIWRQQEVEPTKYLKYCFMFLDYPSNGKNILAWKILLKTLSEITSNEDENDLKAVKSLWKSRCRFWEWMHFNSHTVQLDVNDSLLVSHKVAVLLFFDNEHSYIKEVLKQFPNIIELANSLKKRNQDTITR